MSSVQSWVGPRKHVQYGEPLLTPELHLTHMPKRFICEAYTHLPCTLAASGMSAMQCSILHATNLA